ncbi:hypothetical protein FRC08_014994 [Ceratobasidium sp. 394]|nr:hypothetical protein FRC08_014994 [Ceratobasidium sp. 394]
MSEPNADPLGFPDPDTLDNEALSRLLVAETEKRTMWPPDAWQVRVAVAILRRRDVLVIAGTGFGKTITFVMALFVLRKKTVVWIISPLNYIENEQVKAFEDLGLKAVAVNRSADFSTLKEVSWRASNSPVLLNITVPSRTSSVATTRSLSRRQSRSPSQTSSAKLFCPRS